MPCGLHSCAGAWSVALWATHALQVQALDMARYPEPNAPPVGVTFRNTLTSRRTHACHCAMCHHCSRYGKQLVPVTELEEAALRAPLEDKALKVVGFVARERIMRHQFMKVRKCPALGG